MRSLGHLTLICTPTSEEKDVEVLGVTPRCPNPSLDVRWSISGVYILRLYSNQLLVIPKDRVRGRDPTPWKAKDPGRAWTMWWLAPTGLSTKEKKKRCPEEFWLPEEKACSARGGKKMCKYSAFSPLCVQCGKPRPTVEDSAHG
jgi:hypothetical protein